MRALVLVTIVAVTVPLGALPAATLSPKDIADAIQLGNFGEPAPYRLHGRSVDPRRRNAFELAAVYTPFVRVALAARSARDAGHVLLPDDVDSKLVEPSVFIAFRWVARDSEHADSVYAEPQVFWIFKRNIDRRGLPRPRNGTDPICVKRGNDATALLASFGAERPYDDFALVAAFPSSCCERMDASSFTGNSSRCAPIRRIRSKC
jgi:hypothetical protein